MEPEGCRCFSLQLLELASPLNDRCKAKRVVVGCILPLPAVSCTQQALTVTVAISSGCLYEYVWSLDRTKWWAHFTLTFLCCCLLRGLSHVSFLHYRHFCPLWAVDGCPPSDAFFTFFFFFFLVSCPLCEAAMPPVGLLVSCPLRRQPCPLWAFW